MGTTNIAMQGPMVNTGWDCPIDDYYKAKIEETGFESNFLTPLGSGTAISSLINEIPNNQLFITNNPIGISEIQELIVYSSDLFNGPFEAGMTIGISIGENEPGFSFEFDTYHIGNSFDSEYGGYVNEYVGVQGGGSLGRVVEFTISRNINKPFNIAYKFGISVKNTVDNTIYYSRPITIRV